MYVIDYSMVVYQKINSNNRLNSNLMKILNYNKRVKSNVKENAICLLTKKTNIKLSPLSFVAG